MGKELVRSEMIVYEPMNSGHVSQIAALEKQCFSDPWSERSISSELENPLSLWLVAREEDRVVGYVGSQSVLGEADMMNLAVSPASRGQGVARTLVGLLIKALSERDVRALTLEVRASNTPAIRLYESLGFSPVGRRPRYYEKPREDALIYRKEWRL